MMPAYSIQGYLSALRFRNSCTVLVEGPTDREAVSRVELELRRRGRLGHKPVVVDSVEIVKGDGLLLGNREYVEHVHSICTRAGARLGALTDREYRDFDFLGGVRDLRRRHCVLRRSLYWTRGHSLENYFLSLPYFNAFIRFQFPDRVSEAALGTIATYFLSAVRWAAAFSIAAYTTKLLNRCRGVCEVGDWRGTASGELLLDCAGLAGRLTSARGVAAADAAFLAAEIPRFHSVLEQLNDRSLDSLVTHGHVGVELIWRAVAWALAREGVDQEVVAGVARGFDDTKRRCAVHRFAEEAVRGSTDTPVGLWRWLRQNT